MRISTAEILAKIPSIQLLIPNQNHIDLEGFEDLCSHKETITEGALFVTLKKE
jgi:hypothetical protein